MTESAIYLRTSLDATGEGLAIDRQREACRQLALGRGWRVVAEFADTQSAFDGRQRPGYTQLVEAHRAGLFTALVVWDLDRLTRRPRELEDWIDAATERGLALVTANGEADLTTDAGRLFARIKAAVASGEVERKAARQRAAAAQRAQLGRPPLGVRLTGYTPKGELIEDEAKHVREMFEGFAAGESLHGLANRLTRSRVPTRHGNPWNPATVRTMLRNPRYAGRAIYQGAPTGGAGTWPAIVTGECFDAVNARLDDPRRALGHGTHRKHLGGGLFRCGHCGRPVSTWSGDRYRCRIGRCMVRRRDPIDEAILGLMHARLSRPDAADLLPAEDAPAAASARAEVDRLRGRLAAIEADYDAGLIDGRRFAVATEKVKAELATVTAALARAVSNAGVVPLLYDDPAAVFDAAPLMIKRSVIDLLCEVRLFKAPRGRKGFDPDTIEIVWR